MRLNATAMDEGEEVGADQRMVQPGTGAGEAGQGRDVGESPACAEDHGGVLAHLHEMSAVLVVLGVCGQAVGGYVAKAGDPRVRNVAYLCVEVPCQDDMP